MSASRLTTGLLGLAILGLGSALFFQRGARLALQAEIEALRAQARTEAATPSPSAETHAATNADYLELMRLRGEVGALRKQLAQSASNAKTPPRNAQDVANKEPLVSTNLVIPFDDLRFMGYGSPEDALQSMVFAMKSGDTNLLLSSVSPGMEAEVLKEFEGKSAAEIAETMKRDLGDMEKLDFGRKTTDDSGVVSFKITVKEEFREGESFKDEVTIHFKNVNGEWKFTTEEGDIAPKNSPEQKDPVSK